MAQLSESKKVALLEDAVLRNDIPAVNDLFASHGPIVFTAKAMGLAMRYVGADMVQALINNGATLSYTKTAAVKRSLGIYKPPKKHPDGWREVESNTLIDFAQYLFPCAHVGGYHRPVISEEERMRVATCLVQANLPGTHSLLYYAILYNDIPMIDLLMENRITNIPSPYLELLHGYIFKQEMDPRGYEGYVEEMRKALKMYDDDTLLDVLHRFVQVGHGPLAMFQYSVLPEDRALRPNLFPFCVEHTDYVATHEKWDIVQDLIAGNHAADVAYILEHGWIAPSEREYLLSLTRSMQDVPAEIMSMVLTETAKDDKTSDASSLSLDGSIGALKKVWRWHKREDGTLEITSYRGNEARVVVPEEIGGVPVTSITPNTFRTGGPGTNEVVRRNRQCITSIEFPGTISEIPAEVLSNYYGRVSLPLLREIIINEGTTAIGYSSFTHQGTLERVVLPQSLRVIKDRAFGACRSLSTLHFPEGLESIGVSAFSESGLLNLFLPSSLVDIGTSAFAWCSRLRSVEFKNGTKSTQVLRIGADAFAYCRSLSGVKMNDRKYTLGADAFFRCELLRFPTPTP